jgi:hypothetical protein
MPTDDFGLPPGFKLEEEVDYGKPALSVGAMSTTTGAITPPSSPGRPALLDTLSKEYGLEPSILPTLSKIEIGDNPKAQTFGDVNKITTFEGQGFRQPFGDVNKITSKDFVDLSNQEVARIGGSEPGLVTLAGGAGAGSLPPGFVLEGQDQSSAPSRAAPGLPRGYVLDNGGGKAEPKADNRSEFMKGLVGGLVGQTPKMVGDALEGFGHISGSDTLILHGGDISKWGAKKLKGYQAKAGSITDVWKAPSKTLDYLSYGLGQGLSSIAPGFVGMIAGGAAGSVAGMPLLGAVAGVSMPSYIQNYGDVYGSAKEDAGITKRVNAGEISKADVAKVAAIAAIPMAILDSLSLLTTAGLSKAAAAAAKAELRKMLIDSVVKKSLMRAVGKGMATEGITEGIQEVISQWAQDWLGSETSKSDKFIKVVDNAILGSLPGGAIAGAHGAKQKFIDGADKGPSDLVEKIFGKGAVDAIGGPSSTRVFIEQTIAGLPADASDTDVKDALVKGYAGAVASSKTADASAVPAPSPVQPGTVPKSSQSGPPPLPSAPQQYALLRKAGYSAQDIMGMAPAQIQTELLDAESLGVTVEPDEIAAFSAEMQPQPASGPQQQVDDSPSAEPFSDIRAQITDVINPDMPRSGVYLSVDNIASISGNPEQMAELDALVQSNGLVPVPDIDGKGGVALVKDQDTANAVGSAVQSGQDLQSILGMITGAGTGKVAGADTVVQQRTPKPQAGKIYPAGTAKSYWRLRAKALSLPPMRLRLRSLWRCRAVPL